MIDTKEYDCGQLRLARRAKKMKQQDVADILHVSASCIANMENGRVRTSAEDLAILADAYGVDVTVFFKERGNRHEF